MKKIELWADGYSIGNTGKSGIGIVLIYQAVKREYAFPLGVESTFRAELLAIIHGLRLLKEPCAVSIFSDNQVAIKCISGEYRRASNLDLWKEYEDAAKGHEIIATWITKDSTEWNKKANELSLKSARSQKEWRGE